MGEDEVVRSTVQGVNLPPADTTDAETFQACQPRTKVIARSSVTFVGTGINFLPYKFKRNVLENGKVVEKIVSDRIEVAFTKAKNYRFVTNDEQIIRILKKQGYKIVSQEVLQKERAVKFKEARSQKSTNASMQDYVDARLEELSNDHDQVGLSQAVTDLGQTVADIIKDIGDIKTTIASYKPAVAGPRRASRAVVKKG